MKILFILFALAVIAAFVALYVWAYGDAESRGKPGWLVVLMMLLLSPVAGLVVWLLIRPEEALDDAGAPRPVERGRATTSAMKA